jgi:hypothetical protein
VVQEALGQVPVSAPVPAAGVAGGSAGSPGAGAEPGGSAALPEAPGATVIIEPPREQDTLTVGILSAIVVAAVVLLLALFAVTLWHLSRRRARRAAAKDTSLAPRLDSQSRNPACSAWEKNDAFASAVRPARPPPMHACMRALTARSVRR